MILYMYLAKVLYRFDASLPLAEDALVEGNLRVWKFNRGMGEAR